MHKDELSESRCLDTHYLKTYNSSLTFWSLLISTKGTKMFFANFETDLMKF